MRRRPPGPAVQRRGRFRRRCLRVLLIPVLIFTGAAISMHFQPPNAEVPKGIAEAMLPGDVVVATRNVQARKAYLAHATLEPATRRGRRPDCMGGSAATALTSAGDGNGLTDSDNVARQWPLQGMADPDVADGKRLFIGTAPRDRGDADISLTIFGVDPARPGFLSPGHRRRPVAAGGSGCPDP